MKFSGLLTTLLFASGSLAAMGTERRRARQAAKIARRSGGERRSNPKRGDGLLIELSNTSYVEYSTNWAGAVLSTGGFDSVAGTVTVPEPSIPSGGNDNTAYYASAWVGIDGDTCQNAILQTGIDVGVEGDEYLYEAWYEWYPDYSYTFDITINEGDSIYMVVDASSKTAGTATIENLTTGKSVSHTFSSQTYSLCESDAEWIVEDFESDDELVAFADFGEFIFTGASATTTDGGSVGVEDATILDIEQSGTVLTDCGVSGDSEVYCKYV